MCTPSAFAGRSSYPVFGIPLSKHEKKKAGHGTYNIHENDFFVGLNAWNTNIITIVVPKHGDVDTDGNLRQKGMHLFTFSKARYYGEAGILNTMMNSRHGVQDEIASESYDRGDEPQSRV
jgi:hypothetical protein